MKKRAVSFVSWILVIFICMGCAASEDKKYTQEELDGLVKIEIYSAESEELLKTVEDEETLYQYNQLAFYDSDVETLQEELKEKVQDAKEAYFFISYKSPSAVINNGELEQVMTLTLYQESNVVKMTVSPESIKNISLPEELLTFYYEVSEEEREFYMKLAEGFFCPSSRSWNNFSPICLPDSPILKTVNLPSHHYLHKIFHSTKSRTRRISSEIFTGAVI